MNNPVRGIAVEFSVRQGKTLEVAVRELRRERFDAA